MDLRKDLSELHALDSEGVSFTKNETPEWAESSQHAEDLRPWGESAAVGDFEGEPNSKRPKADDPQQDQVYEDQWDSYYHRLAALKFARGTTSIQPSHEDDPDLAHWCEIQRKNFNENSVTQSGSQTAEGMKDDVDTRMDLSGSTLAKPAIDWSQAASDLAGAEGATMEDAVELAAAIGVDTTRETSHGRKPLHNSRIPHRARKDKLDELGFVWFPDADPRKLTWDAMFEQLAQYRRENGHCFVTSSDDHNLKEWVKIQDDLFRNDPSGIVKNRPNNPLCATLTEDRRRRLQSIGFQHSIDHQNSKTDTVDRSRCIRSAFDDHWDELFDRLVAYKTVHQNCLVPKRYKPDAKLGTWVDTQRVQYKRMQKKPHAASSQMKERIRRLTEIGFVWSIRDDWEKHFAELKEFKKEHSHCNVPARYSKNRRLGIWVSAQRQNFKNCFLKGSAKARSNPLSQDRINKLNEVGFAWALRSRYCLGDNWCQRFAELQKYKLVHGDTLVPSRYPENPELGIWVGTQRTQYRWYRKANENGQSGAKSSSMTEERIRLLHDIGFVFALRHGQNCINSNLDSESGTKRKETKLITTKICGSSANQRLYAADDVRQSTFHIAEVSDATSGSCFEEGTDASALAGSTESLGAIIDDSQQLEAI